jgi:hypothetical protein
MRLRKFLKRAGLACFWCIWRTIRPLSKAADAPPQGRSISGA